MIKENYLNIIENINQACKNAGRDSSTVRLVAVSKTKPVDVIREAIQLGLKDFGENKAQELKSKVAQITNDITWHFIGHLQTNKVKDVVPVAEYIHAVDSIKLAKEINKRALKIEKKQKILLEINTSLEASKFGLIDESEIMETALFCANAENLNLVGLMTMAPYTGEEKILRNCFIKLRSLKEKLNKEGFNLTELSMGMTNDYKIAIEEGATMIRIGTALFGERNYQG